MSAVVTVFKRLVIIVALGAVAAIAAAAATMVIGMRRKSAPVLGLVRRFNHDVVNPEQLKTAGAAGSRIAVIRHVGRTSGAEYETPVQAVETDDGLGFAIPMPYELRADWVRNVLASGTATIVHDGTTHAVDQPTIVMIDDVDATFPPADERAHRLFAVERCLRFRRVEAPVTADEPVSA